MEREIEREKQRLIQIKEREQETQRNGRHGGRGRQTLREYLGKAIRKKKKKRERKVGTDRGIREREAGEGREWEKKTYKVRDRDGRDQSERGTEETLRDVDSETRKETESQRRTYRSLGPTHHPAGAAPAERPLCAGRDCASRTLGKD